MLHCCVGNTNKQNSIQFVRATQAHFVSYTVRVSGLDEHPHISGFDGKAKTKHDSCFRL